jgi:hypothetical protein
MRSSNIFLMLLISAVSTSCNQIGTKSEQLISDEIKKQLTNTPICEGVKISEVTFDNNPDDNPGITDMKLSGTATFEGGVERVLSIKGDVTNDNSWKYTIEEETAASMKKRFLQLITSGSFSAAWGYESEISRIEFSNDGQGHYYVQDGDRYNFNYELSEIIHLNDFPSFSSGAACSDIESGFNLKKQEYKARLSITNNRVAINGFLTIRGPENTLKIKGEVTNQESSESTDIEYLFSGD